MAKRETLAESMRRFQNILLEGVVTDELQKLYTSIGSKDPEKTAVDVAARLQSTMGKHDSGHSDVGSVNIDQEFLRDIVLELESMISRRRANNSPHREMDGEDVEEAIANVLYRRPGGGGFDAEYEHEYEAEQDAYASRIVPAFGFKYEPVWSGYQPDRGTDEEQWQSYKEDEYTKDPDSRY